MNFTCFQLRAAIKRLTKRYNEALAPLDLRIDQFAILSLAEEMPVLNVTGIAALLDADVSTATRNIRVLISRGYVVTGSVQGDARQRQVSLTTRGKLVLANARERWLNLHNDVVREFGEGRLEQLHALLLALGQNDALQKESQNNALNSSRAQ